MSLEPEKEDLRSKQSIFLAIGGIIVSKVVSEGRFSSLVLARSRKIAAEVASAARKCCEQRLLSMLPGFIFQRDFSSFRTEFQNSRRNSKFHNPYRAL